MSNILIISNGNDENYYSNKILIEEFIKRNHTCKLVDFQKLEVVESTLRCQGKIVKQPDLIFINNSIKKRRSKIDIQEEVISYISGWEKDTIIINNIRPHQFFSLKHNTHKSLESVEIELPKTITLIEPDASEKIIDKIICELGVPVVVKKTDGFNGLQTHLCENKEQLSDHLKSLNIDSFSPILLQHYEVDSDGLMIKVRLMGDEICAVYRLYNPYKNISFKGEKELGHMAIAMIVDDDLRKIVKNISSFTGLEVAWLDFFFSNNTYKLCEINVPGGIYNSIFHNVNPATEIVDYCLTKLENMKNV